MQELANRRAAPDGTAPRLSDKEVRQWLLQVPGWTTEGDTLCREVRVNTFKEALALLNRIGDLAEQENHHPDMHLYAWNHVRLELYTHTAHGLSLNDFIMAAKFSRLLE